MDGISQVFQAVDETLGVSGFGSSVEVIISEVLIECAVLEHVIDGGDDGSRDSTGCLLRAATGANAMMLGSEIALLFARGGPGALDKSRFEPWIALAQTSGSTLAGALVVARTQGGPGDEVAGGREAAHVSADFGEDDPSAEITDPGDRCQEADRLAKGFDNVFDLPVDLGDGGIEENSADAWVDLIESVTGDDGAMARQGDGGING